MKKSVSLGIRFKQAGAVAIEFIIAMPIFLILLFAILEVSYVYRAKSTLNTATFEAVRAGTLNNGSKSVMRNVLANGMMPEFVDSKKTVAGITKAYAASRLFEKALHKTAVGKVSTIQIISPNLAIFDAFKVDVPTLDEKKKKFRYVRAIPNDNLQFRPTSTKRVKIAGKKQEINVQDANLLKVKSLWCHKLRVPGLRDIAQKTLFEGFFGVFRVSAEQRSCNLLGVVYGGKYAAISSHSILRMQTPIYKASLK